MPSYTAPTFAAFGRNEYLRSTRGHIFEHYTVSAQSVANDANGNKVLQAGTVLAKITSSAVNGVGGTTPAGDIGKVGPYCESGTTCVDGRQTAANIVGICDSFFPYQLVRGDREVAVLKHGRVVGANLYVYVGASIVAPGTLGAAAGTITALRGAQDLDILVF